MQNSDLSTTHTNAEDTANRSNSSTQIEMVPEYIEGTPFAVTGTPKMGFWIMWGKFIISQKIQTKEEAFDKVANRDWEVLCNAMSIIAHSVYAEGKNELINKKSEQ